MIGGIACGKSGRAQGIADFLCYRRAEMSDILRAKNDPEINAIMEAGQLVPDGKSIPAFISDLQKNGFQETVSSGFPRNVHQAREGWLYLSSNCAGGRLLVINIIRPKEECRVFHKLRKRPNDDFDFRWSLYEKEHPATVNFLRSKIGHRLVDFQASDCIESDVRTLCENIAKLTMVGIPRRKRVLISRHTKGIALKA